MRKLIRGGLVFDGLGTEPEKADVLLEGDKICAVGQGLVADDAELINARGKCVTPGFVDIHRHCDIAPMADGGFGRIELAQGITTTVVGNCGLAPVPVAEAYQRESCAFIDPVVGSVPEALAFRDHGAYYAALEAAGLPLNMGVLVGTGAVKTAIKGFTDVPYNTAELAEAAAYVREAMAMGAYGVSVGIMYQPECYSTAGELAAVVRPAAEAGGVLTAHIRGEGDSLVESVEEIIEIAKLSGIRPHISHFKATGISNWNEKIHKAIEKIEMARADGIPMTADFYPYEGGSTTLLSLVPPSVLGGGGDATLRLLASPEGKALLRREIYKVHPGWDNMALSIGWERILIAGTSLPEHAGYGGRDIAALSAEAGYSDPSDFVCDLAVAEEGRVGIIVLSMSQQDVDNVARLPWTAVISDALYGGGTNPHPRLYGSFPKVIREYVRERNVLDLPRAVHKMTGLPAEILGLSGRGVIKPGAAADILVFDTDELKDKAVYTNSRQLATGMSRVIIAGETVWQDESLVKRGMGRVLRREDI